MLNKTVVISPKYEVYVNSKSCTPSPAFWQSYLGGSDPSIGIPANEITSQLPSLSQSSPTLSFIST